MFTIIAAAGIAGQASQPITVEGSICHPRRLIVRYERLENLKALPSGIRVIRTLPQIQYAVIEVPSGTLQLSRSQVQKIPGIVRADLDRASKPAYTPNDPEWPNMWHMKAIRADYAWDTTFGSPNVTVAVIDTGVLTTHPDLAANIWQNNDEIAGNGIDDDANGYIDDKNGYDFAYLDPIPNDVHGHGTACAGIVAAVQDNALGVTGVAPNCKVMALKACIDSGYFYDSFTAPAYIYAADNGAKVLSMSYFSDRVSQIERDAMDYAVSRGVLPVAAAGNASSTYPYYPGAYENVLSVAALDGNLNKAGFSNYGSWVDVSAPGTGLRTTTNGPGYTSSFGGTSGACPHVAGIAALCFSVAPNASSSQVRNAIEDTAIIQSQAPFGEFANYGRVDAEAAVLRMLGGPERPHPPVVRYVTRVMQKPNARSLPLTRIYGRGFAAPNSVTLIGTLTRSPIIQSRDFVDVIGYAVGTGFQLQVNGAPVTSLAFPATGTNGFFLAEASTQGASLFGGFIEALNPDSQSIRVTKRSDHSTLMEGTFRRVITTPAGMKLTVRRQYTG
ncbi:MAG TPA: S8 family peptidase, partial [Fimbriimonas sp.]|nr:S8 family peptidase [Fimbriimonas sp.]